MKTKNLALFTASLTVSSALTNSQWEDMRLFEIMRAFREVDAAERAAYEKKKAELQKDFDAKMLEILKLNYDAELFFKKLKIRYGSNDKDLKE
jgi:hypothetical protein